METKFPLRGEGVLVYMRGAWAAGENYCTGNIVTNTAGWYCTAPHVAAAVTEPGVGADYLLVWSPIGAVVTGADDAVYTKVTSVIPYHRMVDGSGNDMSIKFDAGVLKFYDNVHAVLRTYLNMLTGALCVIGAVAITGATYIVGATSITGALTVSTPKTDHQLALDHVGGISTVAGTGAVGGTWTPSEGASDNIQVMTRTAAAAEHYYRIPIRIPKRSTASKGGKLVSVMVSYTVGGTIDTAADILQAQIIKQTMGLDGSAPTSAILAGDDDADYDTDHNTNAERLAAGSHTLTVTIPSGERVYAATREHLALRVRVKDAATANMTFVLLGAEANYESAEY